MRSSRRARGRVTAAFHTAKDGVGQASWRGTNEWMVFRVTDVHRAAGQPCSDDMKKLEGDPWARTDRRNRSRIRHQA